MYRFRVKLYFVTGLFYSYSTRLIHLHVHRDIRKLSDPKRFDRIDCVSWASNSMGWCKTAVTSLTHWSYCSLAPTHRNDDTTITKQTTTNASAYSMGNTVWGGIYYTWWRHQMETFSALLAFCAGNSPVTPEFPAQRQVTRSFDVFFDLCVNKR